MTTTQQRVELAWDDARDASVVWTRTWGPMTRLYQDAQIVYGDHQRRCWEFCASPMAKDHIFRIVDGWLYRRGPDFDGEAAQRLAEWQKHIQGFLARGQNWYEVELKPQVVEIVERLRKHPRPTRPLPELVAHLEECIDAYGHIMGDLHWRMAAGMVRTDEGPPKFDWPDTYAEITGRPASEASALVSGLTNEMTKTIRRIRKLARLAADDTDLLAAVGSGDVAALDDERFRRFRSGFRSLLRRSGHRTGAGWGSSVTFGSPTWNVRPDIPLRMIATYARSDLDEIERKEREATRERKRLLRTIRRELKDDEQRLTRFEIELRVAQARAYLMEDHNEWMDQSSPGVLRDAAHVVGLRLVRDGVIDDPQDVVHLSLDELRSPPSDARELVAERQREFEGQKELDPPEHLGGGDVPPPPAMNMDDKGEGHVGNTLRGVAASAGRYTGRARVRLPAPIPPDVEDGDILVAIDAGPDWTPVFAILGAVVLDKGAAWQHAAVVAREFGIPAVTGTVDGTKVIEDGQTITVDGDAGVVELS